MVEVHIRQTRAGHQAETMGSASVRLVLRAYLFCNALAVAACSDRCRYELAVEVK